MKMLKCILLTKDDYNSVLSHLKSARIECQSASESSLFGSVNLYHVNEIDRQLEAIETLLKKKGL